MQEQGANSLPSSSERSSSSVPPMEVKGGESDEEIRRVPELGSELAGPSSSGAEVGSAGRPVRAQSSAPASQRKRGRSPADKEHKRLKRLLRNRVSAQQARERKKAYLNDLETRAKDLEKRNAELEQRVSTLQNENNMLRQVTEIRSSCFGSKLLQLRKYSQTKSKEILKNTTVGRKGSSASSTSKAE